MKRETGGKGEKKKDSAKRFSEFRVDYAEYCDLKVYAVGYRMAV